MATIDNLNFEVILDDAKFLQTIQKDLEAAQKLNTSLSQLLDLKKQISGQNAEVSKELKDILSTEEKIVKASERAAKGQDKIKGAAKQVSKETAESARNVNTMGKALSTVGQLFGVYFSAQAIRSFVSSVIEITGQFEMQQRALQSMLGDVDQANSVFRQLYEFSSDSTYRFSELAKYAKQLAAFNVSGSDLLDTTKMLGDIAAGLGVSMDRLILAYGQVKSATYLKGTELRQFTEAGVPLLQELSDMLTETTGKVVTLGDVFNQVSKRKISFEMVNEALRRMTSEGGKFYNMQSVIADTLAGQMNILKGRWENLQYALGQANSGPIKAIVASISDAISSTEKFGQTLAKVGVALGSYAVAVTVAQIALGKFNKENNLVIRGLANVWKFLSANPWVAIGAAVAALATWVYTLTQSMSAAEKITKAYKDATNEFNGSLAAEIGELDYLTARLKMAEEGTENYDQAKRALMNRFGPYIEQLRQEGKDVSDLSALYGDLASKIRSAAAAQYVESASRSVMKEYGEGLAELRARADKIAKREGFTNEERAALDVALRNRNMRELTEEGNPLAERLNRSVPVQFYKMMSAYEYLFGGFQNRIDNLDNAFRSSMDDINAVAETIVGATAAGTDGTDETIQSLRELEAEIKRVKSELKDLRAQDDKNILTAAGLERIQTLSKDEQSLLQEYRERTGRDYGAPVVTGDDINNPTEAQKRAAQNRAIAAQNKEISALNKQATTLRKYLDAYEKLEPYLGTMTGLRLSDIFGGSDYDYEPEVLLEQIDEIIPKLRKLGENGELAAEQLEASLGLDDVSQIVKEQKALKTFTDTIDGLRGAVLSVGGTGVSNDIDKIVRKYLTANAKADAEMTKAREQLAKAYKDGSPELVQYTEELENLNAAKKESNRLDAQNSLNDLAESLGKDLTRGLDLKDWSDKTLGQIRAVMKQLQALGDAFVVDDAVRERLEKAGLDVDVFAKKVKEYLESLGVEVKTEETKKIADLISNISSSATSAADALKEWADAAGKSGLSTAMDGLSQVMSIGSSFVSSIKTGNVAQAFSSLASSVISGLLGAAAAEEELKKKIREAREEARKARLEGLLTAGVSSVFGDSDMAKARAAVNAMREAQKAIDEQNIDPTRRLTYSQSFFQWWWNNFQREHTTLEQMAAELGRDLYDEYGNLNADTLQAILDTYDDLKVKDREWITEAIDNSEAYKEAMEQLDEVVEGLFGSIADDMVDTFIDNFLTMGDAVSDLSDTFENLGDTIVRSLMKSFVLDEILNKYEDEAREITRKYASGEMTEDELIERVALLADKIASDTEKSGDVLNAWLNSAYSRGLLSSDTGSDGSASSLKEGINKELVEGNSSLIASYINAIRADVSRSRSTLSDILLAVQAVRVPDYNEYLAQVAATTHDMSLRQEEMLSRVTRLASTVTQSVSGGAAIRVSR